MRESHFFPFFPAKNSSYILWTTAVWIFLNDGKNIEFCYFFDYSQVSRNIIITVTELVKCISPLI